MFYGSGLQAYVWRRSSGLLLPRVLVWVASLFVTFFLVSLPVGPFVRDNFQ